MYPIIYTDYAFQFIFDNGSIQTEQDYPYMAVDGDCNITKQGFSIVSNCEFISILLQFSGYFFEGHMVIDFNNFSLVGHFQGKCGTNLNYAVAIVGYETENDVDYWIVKNSWEDDWGEGGYIRMQRNIVGNSAGLCGIVIRPSYPIKIGFKPLNPMPIFCDEYKLCPMSSTCYCVYRHMLRG
ncbi:Oryzain alpha chain [Nymphaea thermarum]|nr:Oryzain alpha chain [Nymphaea thermarum]